MTDLHSALAQRFGEHRVSELPVKEGEMPLLLLDLELNSPVTILMTDGLSNYTMPIPEKMKGREHNELYFCLPSYWEWDDLENPNMNWIFTWIQKLSKFAIDKKTWFGHGHTMQCGSDMAPLSPTMQQNHFFLTDPMLLEKELEPIEINGKEIHFLSIIPIYGEEMDYKQGKGTAKFQQKLRNSGITEKLDDFRGSVLKSKWRFFKR